MVGILTPKQQVGPKSMGCFEAVLGGVVLDCTKLKGVFCPTHVQFTKSCKTKTSQTTASEGEETVLCFVSQCSSPSPHSLFSSCVIAYLQECL